MTEHYINRAKQEIARLEKLLESLQKDKYLEDFAKEVGENLMVCLVNIPFDQWPDIAQVAFNHTANRLPMVAQEYKSRLPSKSDWWNED